MIEGIDLNETKIVHSVNDDGEEKTRFIIKVITHRQKMSMLDAVSSGDPCAAFDIAEIGIARVENLSVNGAKVDFDVKDKSDIERIPMEVIVDLVQQILVFNGVSAEESKN